MKRLVIVCSFAIVTACVLVQCKNTKNKEHNNNIRAQENKNMVRKKTNSGLEYEILREGSGVKPKKGALVTVHYTGWIDENGKQGRQFDSSYNRNQPFQFYIGIGQVIQGWDEGVLDMEVGEKRRLYIPSHLGYGARGAGSVIPGNANLIFEVELISI